MNDDELTPDEARARDALRSVPAPRLDDVARRRLVRRALDAHSGEDPGDARRRDAGRSGEPRRAWAWIGAAAAVVVALVVVGIALRGDDSDTASSEGAAQRETAVSEPSRGESDGAGESAQSGFAMLESPGEVLAFADGLTVAFSTDATRTLAAAPACADALPSGSQTDASAPATYRGEDVVIVAGRDPDGVAVVYVVASADCRLVETLER